MKILHNKWWLALLSLFLLANCTPSNEDGSALIGVSTQALSASDVTKVTITISGPNISPNIVQDLVKTGSQWKGIIGKIPVGTNRTFTAEAFDSGNNKIYAGSAIHTISKGAPAIVNILLQQVTPPNPFQNTVPDITALTASAAQVGNDETINFTVTANDADGDALTYNWTASTGTFTTGANSTNATWQAPAASFTGNVTISVEVTDGAKGGKTGTSVVIEVQPHFSTGKAKVSVEFNTWPEVSQMTSATDPVAAGQTTQLDVSASDADGDTLSYAWSATGTGCTTGSFNNANAKNPIWTAPGTVPASGTCTLVVTVTDGRQGSTTGSMTVNVGAPQAANVAPKLTTTFQSAENADNGTQLTFRVIAEDPENSSLTFIWMADSNNLSSGITTTGSGPYTSELVWTKAGACGNTISVAVSDGVNTTTHSFSVTCTNFALTVQGSGENFIRDVAKDDNGNLYVAGYFSGTANVLGTTLTSTGSADAFVAKISNSGVVAWIKTFSGSSGHDEALSIVVHSDGSINVAGYFHQQIGIGTLSFSSPNSNTDGFIARLDNNGTPQWLYGINGSGTEHITAISGDGNGSVFVSGVYNASITLVGSTGNGSLTYLPTSTNNDGFVAKINSTGTWQWVKRIASNEEVSVRDIAFENNGYVFVTGAYRGSGTVSGGPLGSGTLNSQGGYDIYLAALDPATGDHQWTLSAGGTGFGESGNTVGVDNNGSVYVGGTFNGTSQFGANSYTAQAFDDGFVIKVQTGPAANGGGTVQFFKAFGGPGGENVGKLRIVGSSMYITGVFGNGSPNPVSFGSTTLTGAGGDDIYVARLSLATLDVQAAIRAGGSLNDIPGGLVEDSSGNIFVVGGYLSTSASFGPITLTSTNTYEGFFWKPSF